MTSSEFGGDIIQLSKCLLSFFFFFLFFFLFGPFRAIPEHMEVPRPGVESELQLQACAIATATQDPSQAYDCSSWQLQILNPLSEARDRTCVLMLVHFITAEHQWKFPESAFMACEFCLNLETPETKNQPSRNFELLTSERPEPLRRSGPGRPPLPFAVLSLYARASWLFF